MKRMAYHMLVALHPPAFRRNYASEMLWIFDESHHPAAMLWDALASVLRQWLLRMGLWKYAAAAAGACLTLALAFGVMDLSRPPRGLEATQLNSPVGMIAILGLTSVLVVSMTLILCVVWFRYTRRRRA